MRFLRYYLGPFGSTRNEFAYFQPSNDLMANLESAHMNPLMIFDGVVPGTHTQQHPHAPLLS